MSALGTKRTFRPHPPLSAIGVTAEPKRVASIGAGGGNRNFNDRAIKLGSHLRRVRTVPGDREWIGT
jgi:hypothetical protein